LKLSTEESKQYNNLLQKERRKVKAEACDLAGEYKYKKKQEEVKLRLNAKATGMTTSGINYAPLKLIFRSVRLPATYVLYFKEKEPVTVGDLLCDMQPYNGEILADPISAEDQPDKAVFYSNLHRKNVPPCIISYSHNGIEYSLMPKSTIDFKYKKVIPARKGVVTGYLESALERAEQDKPCLNTVIRYVGTSDYEVFLNVLKFIQSNVDKYKGKVVLYIVESKKRIDSVLNHYNHQSNSALKKPSVSVVTSDFKIDSERIIISVLDQEFFNNDLDIKDVSLVIIEGSFYRALTKEKRFNFSDLNGIFKNIRGLKLFLIENPFISKQLLHDILYQNPSLFASENWWGRGGESTEIESRGDSFLKYIIETIKNNNCRVETTVVGNDVVFHRKTKNSLNKFFIGQSLDKLPCIICFDGAANQTIYEEVFENTNAFRRAKVHFEFIDSDVSFSANKIYITQCDSKIFSKSAMIGNGASSKSTLKGVVTVLNRMANEVYKFHQEKTVLVTYRSLCKNQKFINKLSKFIRCLSFEEVSNSLVISNEHLIILGRNQPHSSEVILQASAIFGSISVLPDSEFDKATLNDRQKKNSNRPYFNFELQAANYFGAVNIRSHGEGRYFSNEKYNAVLSQIREEKSLQAIHCLKGGKGGIRHALILDSLALNVYINQTFSWSELNPKVAQLSIINFFEKHNGIFICSPTWLNILEPYRSKQQWKSGMRELKNIAEHSFVLPFSKQWLCSGYKPEIHLSNFVPVSLEENQPNFSYGNKRYCKLECWYDSNRQDVMKVAEWLTRHLERKYIPSDR